ncbi:MAG: hypothetical protein KatS3mg121_0440 [Gammaproteobacteria bacterium]|nr:MAG: hypothetical protein KatS3mg121_0440 [Gammaproteobacteria bacterium]
MGAGMTSRAALGVFLAVLGLAQAARAAGDVDERIESLVREASRECRAAKTLRRSDLDTAREHFKNYQALLQQALELRPDLLDAPTPEIDRVLTFCDAVKRDLDRAVALPLFEKGLRECAEARVMIANAAFDEAEEKYRRYLEQKEGALAISESVLEVHENSYEVRLCDRLGEDIAKAREEYQRQLQEAAREQENLFREVLAGLAQAERQCQGAQNLVNDVDNYSPQAVKQIEGLLAEADKSSKAALAKRDQLLAAGHKLPEQSQNRMEALLAGLRECRNNVAAGLTRVKAALASRAQQPAAAAQARKGEDRELRQIVGAPAEYPRRALRRGIEGHVLVSFTVTKEGDVTDIKILEAEPPGYFEDAVIEAVSQYKFQPRLRNGEPVETKDVKRRIVFRLK